MGLFTTPSRLIVKNSRMSYNASIRNYSSKQFMKHNNIVRYLLIDDKEAVDA